MNEVVRIPDIAFTDVMSRVWDSLFFDSPMTEEAARMATSALTDWHNKITMMEMAAGAAYMRNQPKLIGAANLIEDGMCDPDYISACKTDPDTYFALHKAITEAILARPKYLKEIWNKVSVNPAAVAQGVQKHIHIHVTSSLSEIEGFPKHLLQDAMIRKKAVLMYDTFSQRFDTKAGISRIPAPKLRPPRVFQPTDEQRKNSPSPPPPRGEQ